jgi:hypothetical protein
MKEKKKCLNTMQRAYIPSWSKYMFFASDLLGNRSSWCCVLNNLILIRSWNGYLSGLSNGGLNPKRLYDYYQWPIFWDYNFLKFFDRIPKWNKKYGFRGIRASEPCTRDKEFKEILVYFLEHKALDGSKAHV